MLVLAWGITPMLVPLIMLVLMWGIMPVLGALIMLALVRCPHTVEGPGDGLTRGPAATAVEAPRAITPAARAPTSKGRLSAVIFCPRAPTVSISLPYQAVILNSFLICPFLRDTCRVPHGCSGRGQEP
jgi:hypothetical protein